MCHTLFVNNLTRLLGFCNERSITATGQVQRNNYLSLVSLYSCMLLQSGALILKKDLVLLERVQSRAMKFILGDFSSDYK